MKIRLVWKSAWEWTNRSNFEQESDMVQPVCSRRLDWDIVLEAGEVGGLRTGEEGVSPKVGI